MKLDIKKTGLIIAASSAFMVASVVQAEESFKVYGNLGAEFWQETKKANKDAESAGGFTFVDGGNRFGFNGSKTYSDGAVASVKGHIEVGTAFDADKGATSFGGRHANVKVALRSGGTLGLGQQSNLRVSSGWMANSWYSYAAELPRAVNGPRYTGVSYVHGFGIGSFGIMLGIDNTDDGSKTKAAGASTKATTFTAGNTPVIENVEATPASEKANNAIDKMTIRLNVNPTKEVGLQFGYDSAKGDKSEDSKEKNSYCFNWVIFCWCH